MLDNIVYFLLTLFLLLKLITCLSGCGDITEPPRIDGYQQVFIDAGTIDPDSHQIICGNRICESPTETMTNCPKDCLPTKWKYDDPFGPYDPGYIDPIDPPGRK